MSNRFLRIALAILDIFLGVTAIGGGVGLLLGLNAPPVEMLAGSPFKDYVIPGLALLVLVGGSGMVAGILTLRRHPLAPLASGAVGLMIIVFEIVEVFAIGSDPGAARTLQIFYFSLGLLIVVLAFLQWRGERAQAVA
jgi:peptidoglycan/LPS O-acetylase OafA/YrhL